MLVRRIPREGIPRLPQAARFAGPAKTRPGPKIAARQGTAGGCLAVHISKKFLIVAVAPIGGRAGRVAAQGRTSPSFVPRYAG